MIADRLNLLVGSSQIRDLVRGGFVSLVLKGLASGCGFLASLVVARFLGAEAAGWYFLVLGIVSILAGISRLGLDSVLVRYVSANWGVGNYAAVTFITRYSIRSILIASTLAAVFLYLSSELLSQKVFNMPGMESLLLVMSWAIVPVALFWAYAHMFQGKKNMYYYQIFQSLGANSLFLLLFFAGHFFLGETKVLWTGIAYLASAVLIAGWAFWTWSSQLPTGLPMARDQRQNLRQQIVAGALPMLGVAILGMVSLWAGQILLGVWASAEEVAVYSVALRTATMTSMVLMAVNSMAFPKFAAMYHAGDIEAVRRIAIWTTRLMVSACLPLLAAMLVFPEFIMGLFGSEFIVGAPALMVMVAGQFVNVATGSVGGLLSMTGHERYLLVSNIVSAISMLVLCFVFIPEYGAIGAAIAQALSLAIQMLLNSLFVRRLLGFLPMNIFAKI